MRIMWLWTSKKANTLFFKWPWNMKHCSKSTRSVFCSAAAASTGACCQCRPLPTYLVWCLYVYLFAYKGEFLLQNFDRDNCHGFYILCKIWWTMDEQVTKCLSHIRPTYNKQLIKRVHERYLRDFYDKDLKGQCSEPCGFGSVILLWKSFTIVLVTSSINTQANNMHGLLNLFYALRCLTFSGMFIHSHWCYKFWCFEKSFTLTGHDLR